MKRNLTWTLNPSVFSRTSTASASAVSRIQRSGAFWTVFVLLLSFVLLSGKTCVQAQTDLADEDERFVSTVVTAEGVRILKLEYPCDKLTNASVEVRLLSEKSLENISKVRPVYLHAKWMNKVDWYGRQVKDALEDCYLGDEDDNLIRNLSFDSGKVTMNVLGWVGAFGVRDTVVRFKKFNDETYEEETTLIFPNAARTQIGMKPSKADPFSSYSFGFDLVGEEFSQPCQIMVWLLKGDLILVEEIVHWDGHIEKPYVEKVVKSRRVAKKKDKDSFFDDEDEDSEDEESEDEESEDEESEDEESEDEESEDEEFDDEESEDDSEEDDDF